MAKVEKRDARATRARIVAAAARAFSARGFSHVGLRDIASEAGVNAALPNRYFGSKAALFEAAILPHFHLDTLLAQPRAELPAALHAYFASIARDDADVDAFRAVALAQSDPALSEVVKSALDWRVIAPLSRWLGGPHAKERASLIAGILLSHGQLMAQSGIGGDRASQAALIGETVRQICALANGTGPTR